MDLILPSYFNLDPDANSSCYQQLHQMLVNFEMYSVLAEPTHGGRNLWNGSVTPLKQLDHVFVGTFLIGGQRHLLPPLEKDTFGHSTVLFSPISTCAKSAKQPPFSVKLWKILTLAAEVTSQPSADAAGEYLVHAISKVFLDYTPSSRIRQSQHRFFNPSNRNFKFMLI